MSDPMFKIQFTGEQTNDVRWALGLAIQNCTADIEQFSRIEEPEAREMFLAVARARLERCAAAYAALDRGVYAVSNGREG